MGNFKVEVSHEECPTQWPFLYVTSRITVVYKAGHSTQETQTDPAPKNEFKKSYENSELVAMLILLELGGRAKKTLDCIT